LQLITAIIIIIIIIIIMLYDIKQFVFSNVKAMPVR